jgi:hypothetical protein
VSHFSKTKTFLTFSRTATNNAVSIVPPPPPVFLFVRQENEEIFTPLCLAQPTLDGMILAVSAKYQVSIDSLLEVKDKVWLQIVFS